MVQTATRRGKGIMLEKPKLECWEGKAAPNLKALHKRTKFARQVMA